MKLTLGEKVLLSVPVLWLILAAAIAATFNPELSKDVPRSDTSTQHHRDLAKSTKILKPKNKTNKSYKGNWFNRQPVLQTTRTGIWDDEPLCYRYGRTVTRPMSAYFKLPALPVNWSDDQQMPVVVQAGVRDDAAYCHQSPAQPKRETDAAISGVASSAPLTAKFAKLKTRSQMLPRATSQPDLEQTQDTHLIRGASFETVLRSERDLLQTFHANSSSVAHHDLLGRVDSYTSDRLPLLLPAENHFSELLRSESERHDAIFFDVTLDIPFAHGLKAPDTLPIVAPNTLFTPDFEVLDAIMDARGVADIEVEVEVDVDTEKRRLEKLGVYQEFEDQPRENRPMIRLDGTDESKADQDFAHRLSQDGPIIHLDPTTEPIHLPLRNEAPSASPESVPEPGVAAALILVLGGLGKLKRKL
ncbi:MAG: PEP-CTERM sorting domain-containing protein [Leptolyngbyaceae cyanobacterium]